MSNKLKDKQLDNVAGGGNYTPATVEFRCKYCDYIILQGHSYPRRAPTMYCPECKKDVKIVIVTVQ